MVEHAVQHYAYAVLSKGVAYPFERGVVAQAAVDFAVVDGVVAVAAALEHRIEQNNVHAQALEMLNAVEYFIKAVALHVIVLLGSAAVAQRVDIVNY